MAEPKKVTIYTDGGSIGNPGPGGYGVVILDGKRHELSGGFRLTTNNRMELTAAIQGLAELKQPSRVTLYSDSSYVVNGISKGWAKSWKTNGWRKSDKKKALNSDLWRVLLDLCERHEVEFIWVEGHAGNRENERCDRLAVKAAKGKNLPADSVYETENSRQGSLF